MATLKEQVDEAVGELTKTWTKSTWSTSTTAVPDPDDMGYSDAKVVQATYLYSDLIDSSGLVKAADSHEEVASVMSTFPQGGGAHHPRGERPHPQFRR